MKHQVEIEDLRNWIDEQKVLFASSSKEQKRLYSTLRGSFEVHHKGERILETTQAYLAVQEYNKI